MGGRRWRWSFAIGSIATGTVIASLTTLASGGLPFPPDNGEAWILVALRLPDPRSETPGESVPTASSLSTTPTTHRSAPTEIRFSPPRRTGRTGGRAAENGGEKLAESPRQELSGAVGVESTNHTRHAVAIKSGDSLYTVFKTLEVPQSDLVSLMKSGKPARKVESLRPGQKLDFSLDHQRRVQRLVYHVDETQSIHFSRADRGFAVETVETPLQARYTRTSGVINSSLFLAGQRAGLSDRTIMEMVEIFGWDIDFALDIRAGDSFSLIYEELYKDGNKIRDGAILAAQFVNRGKVVRAVRYVYAHGRSEYFSPNGRSMRKAFLRTPVAYSRISSRFSNRRRHPVLNTMRAHRGVDYAAPRGTPVRAAGDGKVSFAGRKGGYGKTVIVNHGGKYKTVYAHLSRYAKRMRRGRAVSQGKTIGYVGSTGLATGPHLHYEFRVRGVHRNPLTVKLPDAAPIARALKKDFLAQTQGLVHQLDVISRTQVAANRN